MTSVTTHNITDTCAVCCVLLLHTPIILCMYSMCVLVYAVGLVLAYTVVTVCYLKLLFRSSSSILWLTHFLLLCHVHPLEQVMYGCDVPMTACIHTKCVLLQASLGSNLGRFPAVSFLQSLSSYVICQLSETTIVGQKNWRFFSLWPQSPFSHLLFPYLLPAPRWCWVPNAVYSSLL